jgi:hypothetical protein
MTIHQQIGPQGAVVATDIQPGMLCRAREKAQAAHLSNIRFFRPAWEQVSRRTVRELATTVGFNEQGCFGNRLAFTMNLEKPSGT